MKKALLVATVLSHIAQFHRPLIKLLKEEGYEIHVVAKNNLNEKNGLKINNVDRIFDVNFGRSPFNRNNFGAYKKLKKIINSEHYDIISCNTPVGGFLTRLAAFKTRKKGTRIYYTAHGFHFYRGASKKNWMIYYPIEKMMARLTDVLITITKEDYNLAKTKKFKTDIKYIHGVGADEKKYLSVTKEESIAFRQENGWNDKFIILCTGELNKNKNQKTVIRAVKKVRENHPETILLLAGNGPEEENLKKLIQELDMSEDVIMLGYHTDLEKYMNVCDMVVSASFREGCPLNIMEAMICEKPIVASINRGHKELITDGKTGFLVKADDVDGFRNRIVQVIEADIETEKMTKKGKLFIRDYSDKAVSKELRENYFKLSHL